ncbi:MAG: hypothetical protein RI897_4268, partial [Verrucomicrobiota bacterium]
GSMATDGALTVGDLTLGNGTLGGTNLVSVSGVMEWTGGTMDGAGSTRIEAGGVLNASGTSIRYLNNGRVLENYGMFNWSDTGRLYVNSGTGYFYNRVGGLVEMTGDGLLDAYYWSGLEVVNEGVWRKSGGVGVSTLGSNSGGPTKIFNNAGLLEVLSGMVRLNTYGTSTHTGSFAVAAGATLDLNQGSHVFDGLTSFTGLGSVRFGTPTTFNTDISVGELQVSMDTSSVFGGNGTLSNSGAGKITVLRSTTLNGSLNIAGTLDIAAGVTLTVGRTLTLQVEGTINNPGVLRVGAFNDLGGTVTGNLPVVVGIVTTGLSIEAIHFSDGGPALVRSDALGRGLVLDSVVLRWRGRVGGNYVVETSEDMQRWSEVSSEIRMDAPGSFTATTEAGFQPHRFYRVREVVSAGEQSSPGDPRPVLPLSGGYQVP